MMRTLTVGKTKKTPNLRMNCIIGSHLLFHKRNKHSMIITLTLLLWNLGGTLNANQ